MSFRTGSSRATAPSVGKQDRFAAPDGVERAPRIPAELQHRDGLHDDEGNVELQLEGAWPARIFGAPHSSVHTISSRMPVSRNALCPCGSGRKYKRCCMRADLEKGRGLSLVRTGASVAAPRSLELTTARSRPQRQLDTGPMSPGGRASEWQVDLVPILSTWDTHTRMVMGLVVDSSGFVLSGDVLESAPSETSDVVNAVAELIEATVTKVGLRPSLVRVRHPAVRAGLAPELSRRGTVVKTARKLPWLDQVRRGFAIDVLRLDDPDLVAVSTGTWSSWGIASAEIADLFRAAANFWSAEPWRTIPGDEAMSIVIPGVSRWNLLVFGAMKETFGVALLESSADIPRLLGSSELHGRAGVAAVHYMSLALLFAREHELPRAVREDVKRNKWPAPGSGMLPMLHAINTPAGGVTRRQIADLTAVLHGTVNFARALEAGEIGRGDLGFWSDSISGVNFIFDPAAFRLHAATRLPATLFTACAEGPGAEPKASIDADDLDATLEAEEAHLTGFERWLQETSGATDDSEQGGDGVRHSDRRRGDVQNAQLFIEFLVNHHGIPLRAASEYDLRLFLHDWVHRKVVMPDDLAFTMQPSLERFFEYLATRPRNQISCPWAQPLLLDRALFRRRRETFPGGFYLDTSIQKWRAEVTEALLAHALVPEPIDSETNNGTGLMGALESDLLDELQRQWLVWRDELIRAGTTDREAVVSALLERQARWEAAPNAKAGGRAPRNAVRDERRRHQSQWSSIAGGRTTTSSPRKRK